MQSSKDNSFPVFCRRVFTWPVYPLGADGPAYLSGSVVALLLRLQTGGLVQAPLVQRGPEQALLSHVGVDVLQHSRDIMFHDGFISTDNDPHFQLLIHFHSSRTIMIWLLFMCSECCCSSVAARQTIPSL